MLRAAVLTLASLVAFANSACAQDTVDPPANEIARRHFDAGTEAFDVGEYERAATEFRAAYELTSHPDLLYNIYSALERAGQIEDAAQAEGYLRDGDPDDDRRSSLQARLARLRARIAEARAERAEAELQAERDAGHGGGDAPPSPTPAPVAPESDGGGVHPAGIGLLVGGGVLLANFAVFAGLAAAEDGNLGSSCDTTCTDDEVSTLATFALVADISWISGAVVAATGLVLLFVLPPEGDGATAALVPWVTPGAAGIAAAGRF